MTVTLLTCAAQPALTPDDERVADALRRRGVDVRACPWSALRFHDAGAAAVLRSTWDYHLEFARFGAWLGEADRHALRLVNSTALVGWNASKAYLRDLADAGVAIPPTVWLDAPDHAAIAEALVATGWTRAVLKPCVSASAHGTVVVSPDRPPGPGDLALLRPHGALLQPFVPEVETRGELSVVFFDAVYSHAVLKRPRAGDFRVQYEFGGTEVTAEPTPREMAFAEQVLSQCPEVPAYARVDLVTTTAGPVLMELELIEPVLFLVHHPEAPERFARAILGRI